MKLERDLLPNDSAVAVQFTVYEMSDRKYRRPVQKELLHITRSGELNVLINNRSMTLDCL
jgi:hypothetical protein